MIFARNHTRRFYPTSRRPNGMVFCGSLFLMGLFFALNPVLPQQKDPGTSENTSFFEKTRPHLWEFQFLAGGALYPNSQLNSAIQNVADTGYDQNQPASQFHKGSLGALAAGAFRHYFTYVPDFENFGLEFYYSYGYFEPSKVGISRGNQFAAETNWRYSRILQGQYLVSLVWQLATFDRFAFSLSVGAGNLDNQFRLEYDPGQSLSGQSRQTWDFRATGLAWQTSLSFEARLNRYLSFFWRNEFSAQGQLNYQADSSGKTYSYGQSSFEIGDDQVKVPTGVEGESGSARFDLGGYRLLLGLAVWF